MLFGVKNELFVEIFNQLRIVLAELLTELPENTPFFAYNFVNISAHAMRRWLKILGTSLF